ncbi:hypothetical protein EIN_129280 [Entamoeba invadens IP1]|uniref:Uncharacterized protein n=1 Tax=Entamoeba invadens IP1 TaxID=370355 RepID=L7FMG6_ENTIV|nr:hypothetical protein EIN_129280 [Entamoeba invadens IP1]ELP91588.1 hypothetical protein EIN_129280 [Entamoeba invadens IP1]|eukprot:XP_004258359.1 hypothetical protein EIN_129280 [Entamoeba invadens IP1]
MDNPRYVTYIIESITEYLNYFIAHRTPLTFQIKATRDDLLYRLRTTELLYMYEKTIVDFTLPHDVPTNIFHVAENFQKMLCVAVWMGVRTNCDTSCITHPTEENSRDLIALVWDLMECDYNKNNEILKGIYQTKEHEKCALLLNRIFNINRIYQEWKPPQRGMEINLHVRVTKRVKSRISKRMRRSRKPQKEKGIKTKKEKNGNYEKIKESVFAWRNDIEQMKKKIEQMSREIIKIANCQSLNNNEIKKESEMTEQENKELQSEIVEMLHQKQNLRDEIANLKNQNLRTEKKLERECKKVEAANKKMKHKKNLLEQKITNLRVEEKAVLLKQLEIDNMRLITEINFIKEQQGVKMERLEDTKETNLKIKKNNLEKNEKISEEEKMFKNEKEKNSKHKTERLRVEKLRMSSEIFRMRNVEKSIKMSVLRLQDRNNGIENEGLVLENELQTLETKGEALDEEIQTRKTILEIEKKKKKVVFRQKQEQRILQLKRQLLDFGFFAEVVGSDVNAKEE